MPLKGQRHRPGERHPGGRRVDTRGQRLAAQVHTGDIAGRRGGSRGVVRRRQVVLSGQGDRIGRVLGAHRYPGRKAGDGRRRVGVQVAVEDARPGVGDPGAGQHRGAAAVPRLTAAPGEGVGVPPTTTPTSGVTVTPAASRRGSCDEFTSATTPLTIGKAVTTRPDEPRTSACAVATLSAVTITRTVLEAPSGSADATWAVGPESRSEEKDGYHDRPWSSRCHHQRSTRPCAPPAARRGGPPAALLLIAHLHQPLLTKDRQHRLQLDDLLGVSRASGIP